MKNTFQFPQAIYNKSLREIEGIPFSAREIEVIAHILLGEETRKIAHNLSLGEELMGNDTAYTYTLSDSTVESHIENIYEKLSPFATRHKDHLKTIIKKRDKIKLLIQKSDKKSVFQSYCRSLRLENLFLDYIEKIFQKYSSLSNSKETITCQIRYWNTSSMNVVPLAYTYLARHLNDRKKKNSYKAITTTLKGGSWGGEEEKTTYSFYVIPFELTTSLSLYDSQIHQALGQLAKEAAKKNQRVVLLLHNWPDTMDIPPKIRQFQYCHFNNAEDYFFSVFDILKNIFPKTLVESGKEAFNKACETLPFEEELSFKKPPVVSKKFLIGGLIFLALSICLVGLLTFRHKKPSPGPTLRSDLVLPVKTAFLERLEILNQIEKKLSGEEDIEIIVLVGAGGAGKTTLARHFGRRCEASLVWEINAETKISLLNSFKDLAYVLTQTEEHRKTFNLIQNIRNPEEQEKQLLNFVKKGLKERPEWLLIYDNVESIEDIKPYLPQNQSIWGRGKVILTMRDANIKNTSFIPSENVIEIDELNQTEALTLFTKILHNGQTEPSEDVAGFLQNIAAFPLDVSLAGYYIKNTYISYKEYLELLEQHSSEFEEMQTGLLKKSGHYGQTRDRIITLSLQKIIEAHQKDFKDLLLFISLLDSQNIPLDLLNTYKEKITVTNFIHLLKEYSLVTTLEASGQGTFSLHRNIQTTMLNHLIPLLNLEKDKHLIEHIGVIFRQYIARVIDAEDFSKMTLLLKHCKKFLSHSNLLTDSTLASTWGELGDIYIYQANYEEAKQAFEKSQEIYKRIPSEEPYWLARTLEGLGNVYSELGYNEKAKQPLEESLTIYKKNGFEGHPSYARASAWLGCVYRELGDHVKAKQLIEESLEIYRKNAYESHPWYARALGDLGSVYRELGNYDKAKQCLEKCLEIYDKNSYKNHPWYARASAWLGCVYRDMGNYDKAKQLLENSLEIYKKVSLEDRPWTARTLAWLGCVYRGLGDYDKAKQSLEKSIEIYQKNLYENHPWLARALGWLGGVYREQGDYEKAKKTIEKSLEIYKKNAYENHPWYAWTIGKLGNIYRTLGNYKEAEKYLKESVEIYKKNAFDNHPWFAWSLSKLGCTYREQGNPQEAQLLIEKSLEIFKENAYENHPWFLDSLENLGTVQRDLGNYEKAKSLLEQSLTLYEKAYGKGHLSTASVIMNLGQLQLLKGELQTAKNLTNTALSIFEKNNHPQKYACLELLAAINMKNVQQSDILKKEAISYLKQALEIAKTHLPSNSVHITNIKAALSKYSISTED